MKYLSLVVFLSVALFSCKKNDKSDDSLFGVWNVTDTYEYKCSNETTITTLEYTYQLSIDAYGEDSIIITNLNEDEVMYGIFTGSSISVSGVSCSATGIKNDNSIKFTTSGYECELLRYYQAVNNVCDPSSQGISRDDISRNLVAVKN